MKKRLCSLLTACALAAGLCAGLTVPAAASFADVTDTETAEAVAVLTSMGVVDGYSSGVYAPEDTLTRAQFCKMIVLATGRGASVSQNSYRALFDDVASNSWALGYINVAYSDGLVAGYGDGTFGPNDGVTVAQAVTIVLRCLGYTTQEVGAFWPEDYLAKAADLGLIDGIETGSEEDLTRGEAARLLYAMLQADTADGTAFVQTIADSTQSDVLLLDNDAESEDGTTGTAAVYQDGSVRWYEQANGLDDDLVGLRGTLLLNASGQAAGFVPDGNAYVRLTPSEVTATAITAAGGGSYTISSSIPVVLDGEQTTYGDCWYDLESRDSVTIFYSSAGAIDLIWAGNETKYDGIQLTGYYEDASPSEANPTTITLLGVEFEVDSAALDTLTDFEVGDRITVTLNAEGAVVEAETATGGNRSMVGVLENESGTVELLNGITIQGTFTNSASSLVGQLVTISSTGIGQLAAYALSSSTSSSLDVSAAKLGTKSLSDSVHIFECVGKSSVREIGLADILVETVSSSDILYVGTDSQGLVNLLLLDDVTGDAYTYGILDIGSQEVQGIGGSGGEGDSFTYSNRTVSVTNGDGTTGTYITGYDLTDGAFGGVAYSDVTGKTTGAATLTKVTGVSRSSFDGSDAVIVDGTIIPIWDEVQVYNSDTGKWITLSEAKAYTDTFTIYYDRTLTTGAKVRIIVTE